MRGPCAGPGAGAGRRHAPPGCFFVRERYFCTFYEAIRAVLPVGLWYQVQDTFTLASGRPWEGKTIRQKDAKAVLCFFRGPGG